MKKTILLVEDESVTALRETKLLKGAGYAVLPVSTGEEAVTIAADRDDIDLILMDIDLGEGIDGTEAARQILEKKDIPVVFLSSHTEPEVVDKTEKITSYGYVVKESGNVVLLASIKMALRLFYAKMRELEKEEALRESNEKFRQLSDSLQEGIWRIDRDAVTTYVNPIMAEMLGYTVDEMIGKHLFDFMEEEAVKIAREKLKDRMDGITESHGIEFTRKNGKRIYAWLKASPLFDNQGDYDGALAAVMDFTEKRLAEENLEKSEQQYRELMEGIRDSVFVLDSSWRHLVVNDAAETFTGLPKEKLLNNSLLDLFPGIEETPFFQTFKKVMEERVPAMIENEYTFQDGRKNWYEVNVYPVPDGILCISRDISSRKKAELALRQSEKVMRYIIRHDPNALAVYDETLRYIAVSDRYLEDYNVKERDIIGKHHYEVFPEMPQRWKDVHQRVLKGTIERNDDDWFERQDGSITHNRWECRPWYRENGTIGGMITYTEVTTRRKKMEASLRESEERFREMAGLLPEAVFELDENLRVTYVNNSALELSGYSREEFDQGINVLDLFDSRDHDRIMDNFRKRITEKIDDPGGFEYTALRRDGATFPVRIHATSIVKNGELCGLRGVAIDITEFKRKEKELLAKEKYLEGIFNGIGMAVFVLDVEDGRYLFSEVNSKYREILDRFGMGDFQGRYLDELTDELPERVREAASQKYGECVSRNETLEYEEMGPPLGGQETWWLTRLRPLTDDDGNVFRIIGSTIEITERKSMEMEMRFKSMLLDQIQDLITATDLEGTIQYVNSAEARMFGVPREELIGKTIFDYGEDEEKGATQKDILETTLDNGSWRGEIVNYSFDGREYILDCRTWKILNEEGEAVALCSVSTDITEQREKDRSLRENRKKLRTIIDEAPIGIFYYNTDGVITECNDVFVSIIGSSRNVLIGMNMPERLKDQKLIKAVQTSLQEGSAYYEDLYESVTADKKTYVRILFKGIRDEDEVITAGVALIEDITERKKAEAKLQEAYRQKESLFRELQHRTMNTFNLLNNMIILKVLSAEAKEARLALEDIAVRIQSLSELYSLLHDSDAHGNISLKDYIPRLVSSISTLSGSIKLVTEVDNVHVSFKNATTLGLIVTELATNSTKHAFPDGRSGRVSISIKRHDDNITIEVRDNGVGLPDGFDPVQTESMGLRLVKDMVDQLQGTLEYDHNGGCEWKITVRGVDAKQDE